MAAGSAPPDSDEVRRQRFVSAYTDDNWFSFREVLSVYGKRPPRRGEFAALAFDVMKKISCGPDFGGSAP